MMSLAMARGRILDLTSLNEYANQDRPRYFRFFSEVETEWDEIKEARRAKLSLRARVE